MSSEAGTSRIRRIGQGGKQVARILSPFALFGLALLNILGLIGFFMRDRGVLLALLLYLPLAPLGLCAAGMGLNLLRKGTWWPGLGLLLLGGAALGASLPWMVGLGAARASGDERARVSVLHWNVLWGGYWNKDGVLWRSITGDIIKHNPDLLVLSEAPPVPSMHRLLERLPGRRFSVSVSNLSSGHHLYHLYVLSRWPARLDHSLDVPFGAAAVVFVEHPEHPLRLLLVDGQSNIRRVRTPFLEAIAATCDEAAAAGKPIDLIVGDFNAISRSIGFDAIEGSGGGYQLAARQTLGWRATWPSFFPLFDIDHIWVQSGWSILNCELFTNMGTDHRGQMVILGRGDRE